MTLATNIEIVSLVILVICIANVHTTKLTNWNENLIQKTQKQLQRLVNKLFNILKVPKNFAETRKNRLMLTMYHNVANMVGHNWKMYEGLKRKINITYNKQDLVLKLIDYISFNNNESTTSEIENESDIEANVTSQLKVHTTEDYIELFRDAVVKINMTDIIDTTSSNLYTTEKVTNNKVMIDDDLKPWIPDPKEKDVNVTNRRSHKRRKAAIHKYPFVVSVHVNGYFSCTGSIISADLVITAASCLQLAYNNIKHAPNHLTKIQLRMGSDLSNALGVIVSVDVVHFHPAYNPKTFKNNLAILKMSRSLSKKSIKNRRIMLDRGYDGLPNDANEVAVLGWGNSETHEKENNRLTETYLTAYDASDCTDVYSGTFVTQKNFCAVSVFKGNNKGCYLDIGGPAIVDGYLVGVISFGPPLCGTIDSPTVFSKIGHYSHWIERILEMEVSMRIEKYIKVTQASMHSVYVATRKTTPPVTHIADDIVKPSTGESFSKETEVLQEIIKDLALGNESLIKELLNSDLKDDFEAYFEMTTSKTEPRRGLIDIKNLFQAEYDYLSNENDVNRKIPTTARISKAENMYTTKKQSFFEIQPLNNPTFHKTIRTTELNLPLYEDISNSKMEKQYDYIQLNKNSIMSKNHHTTKKIDMPISQNIYASQSQDSSDYTQVIKNSNFLKSVNSTTTFRIPESGDFPLSHSLEFSDYVQPVEETTFARNILRYDNIKNKNHITNKFENKLKSRQSSEDENQSAENPAFSKHTQRFKSTHYYKNPPTVQFNKPLSENVQTTQRPGSTKYVLRIKNSTKNAKRIDSSKYRTTLKISKSVPPHNLFDFTKHVRQIEFPKYYDEILVENPSLTKENKRMKINPKLSDVIHSIEQPKSDSDTDIIKQINRTSGTPKVHSKKQKKNKEMKRNPKVSDVIHSIEQPKSDSATDIIKEIIRTSGTRKVPSKKQKKNKEMKRNPKDTDVIDSIEHSKSDSDTDIIKETIRTSSTTKVNTKKLKKDKAMKLDPKVSDVIDSIEHPKQSDFIDSIEQPKSDSDTDINETIKTSDNTPKSHLRKQKKKTGRAEKHKKKETRNEAEAEVFDFGFYDATININLDDKLRKRSRDKDKKENHKTNENSIKFKVDSTSEDSDNK